MTHEHDQPPTPIIFEELVASASEHLLATGSHSPLLVLDGDTNLVGIPLEFPKHTARRQELMYIIGIRAARSRIVGSLRQVFLISEAWMSTPDDLGSGFRPPAQDPNRRDVLLIMSRSLDDIHARVATLELLRDSEGIVRELKDVTPEVSAHSAPINPLLNAFVAGYTQGRASLT